MLQFAFYISVVFAVFGFIWFFFRALLYLLAAGRTKTKGDTYLIKFVHYTLLITVIASFSISSAMGPTGLHGSTLVMGGLMTALYLLGKYSKQRSVFRMQTQFGGALRQFQPVRDQRLELGLLIYGVAFYALCVSYPAIVENAGTKWFHESIVGISETAVIGWIFQIAGFFILIGMFFRAAGALGKLINGNRPQGGNGQGPSRKQSEWDGFQSYEEVDDSNSDQASDK